jgi:hypothetical protein
LCNISFFVIPNVKHIFLFNIAYDYQIKSISVNLDKKNNGYNFSINSISNDLYNFICTNFVNLCFVILDNKKTVKLTQPIWGPNINSIPEASATFCLLALSGAQGILMKN